MHKIETERISVEDGEVLERMAIMKRTTTGAAKHKKATLQEGRDKDKVLIPHQANKPSMNRRSVLDGKYTSGKGTKWRRGEYSMEGLYKRLLAEPDKAARGNLTRRAMTDLRQQEYVNQ